jgi:hypothetical protein
VEQAHNAVKNIECHFDIESVGKSFKRIQKSEKLKKDIEKNRMDEIKAKRDEKRAAAEVNVNHKR